MVRKKRLLMKILISHMKNFWFLNILILSGLALIGTLQLLCKNQDVNFCWFLSSVIIPFLISCAANIFTSQKELKKTADVIRAHNEKGVEMNTICSEMVGYLESLKLQLPDDETEKKRFKNFLTKTKKLQMTILKKDA